MHTADTLNELVDDFLALPQRPSEHFVDFVLANGFTLELWAEEDLRGAAMRLLNTDDMLVIEAWLENFQNFTGQPVCHEEPVWRVAANPDERRRRAQRGEVEEQANYLRSMERSGELDPWIVPAMAALGDPAAGRIYQPGGSFSSVFRELSRHMPLEAAYLLYLIPATRALEIALPFAPAKAATPGGLTNEMITDAVVRSADRYMRQRGDWAPPSMDSIRSSFGERAPEPVDSLSVAVVGAAQLLRLSPLSPEGTLSDFMRGHLRDQYLSAVLSMAESFVRRSSAQTPPSIRSEASEALFEWLMQNAPFPYEVPARRVVANPDGRRPDLWRYADECYDFARERILELQRRGSPSWLQPFNRDLPLKHFCVEVSGLMLACALLRQLPVSAQVASVWIADEFDEGHYHDVLVLYQPGQELWVDPSTHAELRECSELADYEIDWVDQRLALQKIDVLLTPAERRKLGL